ncbi:hemin-degrading factor [Billgrantia endophytica]|uniref:Heme degradation protein n=1 Tax=Billgrantia endophytica TaxID=2033802 RepID=A0A2N7U1N8_9GAMM|nr:ChuX/HutX family heme-like substrate-binding protein [Halomonas endophytica]PMR74349.1 heme degradation protein [Halomonas endophytica]
MTTPSSRQRAILEAFDAAREARPRLPAINIAECLSISEGELQAARLGRDVWNLPLPPRDLASRMHQLGRVKALTRSRLAVLEQEGSYPRLSGGAHAGLMLAPGGLDLRLLFSQWRWACLIRDVSAPGEGAAKVRWSLQIFDRHGRALHKCFALDDELAPTWQTLVKVGNGVSPAFTQMATCEARPLPRVPELAAEWEAMTDVHQFFGLMRRHGLERREANALMEGRFTQALAPSAVEDVLTRAAEQRLPMMLFVASPGCVQIRTGQLVTPQRRRGWLNLFGHDFTLHLDDSAIASVWRVFKPNRDGGVTSLEAFDAEGELVLQLYAERQEGRPERSTWRRLLEGCQPQAAVA